MANNQWISVKDKLPDKTGKYLCVLKGVIKEFYIDIYRFNPNRRIFYQFYADIGDVENDDVLYWMELPELPKELGETNERE